MSKVLSIPGSPSQWSRCRWVMKIASTSGSPMLRSSWCWVPSPQSNSIRSPPARSSMRAGPAWAWGRARGAGEEEREVHRVSEASAREMALKVRTRLPMTGSTPPRRGGVSFSGVEVVGEARREDRRGTAAPPRRRARPTAARASRGSTATARVFAPRMHGVAVEERRRGRAVGDREGVAREPVPAVQARVEHGVGRVELARASSTPYGSARPVGRR